MLIEYSSSRLPSREDLLNLYESVGWSNYTKDPVTLQVAVEGSLWRVSAWDGSFLVGLIRAISDDASIAYAQDLLVRPDYQRLGVGSHLLALALERFAHVRQFVLITDNDETVAAFYRKAGLIRFDGQTFVRFLS